MLNNLFHSATPKSKIFYGLLITLAFGFTWAKTPEQSITLYDMDAKFHSGRSILLLEFKANIPSPWHVYSDSLESQYLIPSSLFLADSMAGKLVQKQFPEPKVKNLLGEKVPVYQGVGEFQGKFYLNSPVKFPQKAVFRFQACDDKMCFPPEEKTMVIEKAGDEFRVKLVN